jgi:hypothetical protein
MIGILGFLLVILIIAVIFISVLGWHLFIALAVGLPVTLFVMRWLQKMEMKNPKYRKRIEAEKRKKRREELKLRQIKYEQIIGRFGKLVNYEEYKAGTICIGISQACKGKKSKGALVCKNCYLAQGFDRPIGFAQSGGGATKDELGEMIVARLGYRKKSPSLWERGGPIS